MVVLKIQLDDLFVLDPERQPPVARDVQAPGALAIARQNMRLPQGKAAQLLRVFHRIEEREHLAELVHGVRAEALRGILLVQPAQAFMDNTPYPHVISVALQDTFVNRKISLGGLRKREGHTVCAESVVPAVVPKCSRATLPSPFRASVRLNAVHRRGEEPEIETQPWLELQGKATKTIRDVKDVKISMYPREPLQVETARPAAVGAIIGAKPELSVVLIWSHVDFNTGMGPRSCRAAQIQPPLLHQAALRQWPRGERVFLE